MARRNGYDDVNILIPAPVRQDVRKGQKGDFYEQYNVQQKPMLVENFRQQAFSVK